MCLNKTTIFPKKAKKDITTYKVIKDCVWSDMYKTPYIGDDVVIGGTYKSNRKIWWGILTNEIKGEGIHSFLKREGTSTITEQGHWADYYVVKCHIPKDSFYYIGEEGDIASSQLTYDEIVETLPGEKRHVYNIKPKPSPKGYSQKKKRKRRAKMHRK